VKSKKKKALKKNILGVYKAINSIKSMIFFAILAFSSMLSLNVTKTQKYACQKFD
jgi:hypothetical protein